LPDGTPENQLSCMGWSSNNVSDASNTGRFSQSDATWTDAACNQVSCTSELSVYCVQQ
jgi:hypothetical protein